MSAIQDLEDYIVKNNVKDIQPSWGPEAWRLTPEERATIIMDVLRQLEDGTATVLDRFIDDEEQVDVREFLKDL